MGTLAADEVETGSASTTGGGYYMNGGLL
jgi:hypothetical protein